MGEQNIRRIVRASDTDWTLARPVALSDKPAGAPLRPAQAGTPQAPQPQG
ncbi:hypothetical protein [Streptomyces sp. NPDC007205]